TMLRHKTRVAILFGGRSAEHDVSRASAANIYRSLDPDRYDVTLIGITADGRWVLADAANDKTRPALIVAAEGPQVVLLPGGQGRALVVDDITKGVRELPPSRSCFRSCMDRTARTAQCKARWSWPTLPMSARA
ncbi:MAG TPA: hypothetical protein VFR21_02425, partial [Bradyrhizobium sp.]|nr:hypothetical protein [Bradyrhizobium sp.]